jgi:hypothetical protein
MPAGDQSVEDIYGLVREAILKRYVVVASYHGYIREMCPHVIGKKKGRAHTLLYQFAGESSSGLQPDGSSANWRCLRVDELSDVAIKKSTGEWHTASNYSAAAQHCVDEIELKV